VSREPEIAFRCPACEGEASAGLDGRGHCPACGASPGLEVPEAVRASRTLSGCLACGGRELYVQRDFNQRAGLAIVVVGAVLAPFTPYYSSLLVAALIDAGLYAMLPEIAICYRCKAHYRRFRRNPEHQPFDLHVEEKYHQRSGTD
jgi:hypothetical protein